ncbi:thiol-disulfide isomerase/thioredoxin [Sporosarcina luteola]|nr:thiol-disulfide isomerase/thioredoxin [Sporosarcina luteola]
MKKLVAIGGVVIVLFVLIIVLTNQSNKMKLKNNPYGSKELEQPTIDLLGNKNYSNIVMPEELKEKIETGEPVTAYFFSPTCPYCMKMTPILMPIAKEKGIHVYQYNMLEFEEEAEPFGITGWPTLIQYEDGKEIGRIVGPQNPEQEINDFFKEYTGK